MSFLDIGCGDGQLLEYAGSRLKSGVQYSGVDYSNYKVKQAKKLRKGMSFKQCNLEEGIPHDSNTFDCVYAGEIIEHLYDPDLMVSESARVLKMGGHLIITTPNLMSWYNRILILFGIQPLFYETSSRDPRMGAGALRHVRKGTVPVGHIRVMHLTALVDHLESAGLKVVFARGAVFEALPMPIKIIDRIVARISVRLSSNIVVAAKKTN